MPLDRAFLLFLRRTLFLALVGAGVVLLGGLIVSVLGAILILALVGLLIWLPLHTLFCGRDRNWRRGWHKVTRFGRKIDKWCLRHAHDMSWELTSAWRGVRTWTGWLGTYLQEMASGAAVGGLLVLALRGPDALSVVLGAAAGLALGTLVAIQRNQA